MINVNFADSVDELTEAIHDENIEKVNGMAKYLVQRWAKLFHP